jgi:hypothetical protein
MEYQSLTLVIPTLGKFKVDSYMEIKFECEYFDDFYWKSHASMLNQRDYGAMYESFNKFYAENELFDCTSYFPTFSEFKQIGEKLFQMYSILRYN